MLDFNSALDLPDSQQEVVRKAAEQLPHAHTWRGFPQIKISVEGAVVTFERIIGNLGSWAWRFKSFEPVEKEKPKRGRPRKAAAEETTGE
ncbi:MAG: hypothetical protein D6816_10655 [Bacteroidetes bacterium]|nr:MAG: hypothetical protein D6816_10655 [Bacteroidota bacterium]